MTLSTVYYSCETIAGEYQNFWEVFFYLWKDLCCLFSFENQIFTVVQHSFEVK